MKKQQIPILIIFAVLFFAVSAFAEIRVVSVKGAVSYKAGGQWVPMQAGTALVVGTKVSTGVRSSAVIQINKHTVTVHPLTIMKISNSVETANSSTTQLGLRRGSLRAKVDENARIKTVFKVSTPVATSSVRGCEKTVGYFPDKGMFNITHKGLTEVVNLNGVWYLIYGKLEFSQKPDKGEPEKPMNRFEEFLTQTHTMFVTVDEETAFKLLGDDFMNFSAQPPGSVNQNSMVPVKVYLVWPSAGN